MGTHASEALVPPTVLLLTKSAHVLVLAVYKLDAAFRFCSATGQEPHTSQPVQQTSHPRY